MQAARGIWLGILLWAGWEAPGVGGTICKDTYMGGGLCCCCVGTSRALLLDLKPRLGGVGAGTCRSLLRRGGQPCLLKPGSPGQHTGQCLVKWHQPVGQCTSKLLPHMRGRSAASGFGMLWIRCCCCLIRAFPDWPQPMSTAFLYRARLDLRHRAAAVTACVPALSAEQHPK